MRIHKRIQNVLFFVILSGALLICTAGIAFAESEIEINPDSIADSGKSESLATGGIEIFTERSITKQLERQEKETATDRMMMESLFMSENKHKSAMEEYQNFEIFKNVRNHPRKAEDESVKGHGTRMLFYIGYILLMAIFLLLGVKISRRMKRGKNSVHNYND